MRRRLAPALATVCVEHRRAGQKLHDVGEDRSLRVKRREALQRRAEIVKALDLIDHGLAEWRATQDDLKRDDLKSAKDLLRACLDLLNVLRQEGALSPDELQVLEAVSAHLRRKP